LDIISKISEFNTFIDVDSPIKAALIAGLITWLITAMGAATIFWFKKINESVMDLIYGFTGGIMLGAAVLNLLLPAIQLDISRGHSMWSGVILGLITGALLMYLSRIILKNRRHTLTYRGNKEKMQRAVLMGVAITIHNLIEGLAIGVLFGSTVSSFSSGAFTGAFIMTAGIGLQNFPEGMAVAFPLRRAGMSRWNSFLFGQGSAIVEPLGAVMGAYIASSLFNHLSLLMAFAGGSMIWVVIREFIPEIIQTRYLKSIILAFIIGVLIVWLFNRYLSS
jgi:ZIP family zinc transporter